MQKEIRSKIINIQEQIVKETEKFVSLHHLLSETQGKVTKMDGESVTQSYMEERESDLQADLALGMSTDSKEYKDIKIELEQHGKNLLLLTDLKKTLAGLTRKCTAIELEIGRLKTEHRTLVEVYLREHLEKLGSRYMKAAENVVSLFREIQAAGAIHSNFTPAGMGDIVSGSERNNIYIPVFNLDSCGQHRNLRGWPNWLKTQDLHNVESGYIRQDREGLSSSLVTEGIDLAI